LTWLSEDQGDEEGKGAWFTVLDLHTFLRQLAERGLSLQEYADKILSGRWGDLLHNLSTHGQVW
jgi:hypothetical protein